MTGEDDLQAPQPEPLTAFSTRETFDAESRPGVLDVFARMSTESGVPLLLVAMPVPYLHDPFEGWIIDAARGLHLPLLDCMYVLQEPRLFQRDLHLMSTTHPLMAQIIARSLSAPATTDISAGLPLRSSSNVETCTYYSSSQSTD
jgi:hypothetical protein